MISRTLNLQIDTCYECPYCKYNGDYGRSYDSGWDCEYLGRLCDDNEFQRYYKKLDEWNDSQKTLFPIPLCEKPEYPFNIPDECPLPKIPILPDFKMA